MSEILREGMVTTRKPHRCWGCVKPIAVGERVMMSVCVDIGKVFTTYMCGTCDKFMSTLPYDYLDEVFAEGELKTLDGYPKQESRP